MTDPEIYLLRHGKRIGPYTIGAIKQMLATKSISSHDSAWYEGLEDWIPVASLPSLAEPAKSDRKSLTVIRSKTETSPVPKLVSTRVARITAQHKMISGEHHHRRLSNSLGPLFAVLGVVILIAGFFYVRNHWLRGSWNDQYSQALHAAADDNKLVFIYFTRSRTSTWCKKLDAETFDQSEFKDYASKNLEMLTVDLDWPRYSNKEIQDLGKRFRVDSVPLVVVLSSQGEILGRFGYKEGGPSVWIDELDKLRQ